MNLEKVKLNEPGSKKLGTIPCNIDGTCTFCCVLTTPGLKDGKLSNSNYLIALNFCLGGGGRRNLNSASEVSLHALKMKRSLAESDVDASYASQCRCLC